MQESRTPIMWRPELKRFQESYAELSHSGSNLSSEIVRGVESDFQTNLAEILHLINRETGLGKRDYALLLLLTTGIKLTELINLSLSDLQLEETSCQLNLTSQNFTKPGKSFRLNNEASRALLDYLEFISYKHLPSSTPLFVRFRKGDRPTVLGLTRRALEMVVAERGKAAGLELSPGDLKSGMAILSEAKNKTKSIQLSNLELLEGTKPELPKVTVEKIRKLGTLVNVARDLTSCRSTLEVVNQVLHSAVAAIETADAGIFYLYEEATGFLRVQHTINFTQAIYRLRIRPGEIMSGKAFASGYGSIFSTADEWLEGFANATLSNKAIFMEATSGKIPQSALIAPLKLKDQPIGVIALDNFKDENAFSANDLDLLQLLANQAAIAVDNIQLYENQTHLVQRLEQALQIHDHLTATVLQGHGVEGIVTRLSRLLGNPVVLFDRYGEIQMGSKPEMISNEIKEAFRDWLAGRPFPAWLNLLILPTATEPVRTAQIRRLGEFTSEAVSQPWNEYHNSGGRNTSAEGMFNPAKTGNSFNPGGLVAPINVGGEVLGWIMIIPEQRPLGEFDSVALEHASTVFGLEFMKQQALFEVEVRWKGDLIDDLLAGKASVDLEKRARGLGITLDEPFICMYFDLDRFAHFIKDRQFSEGEVQKIKERMYQAFSSLVKSFVPAAFISLKSAEFIVFFNVPSFELKSSQEIARQIAESFQGWLRRFYPGLSVSVAISGVASSAEAMGLSLLEAQRVLKLYHQAGRYGGIFFTEELGVDRLLLQFPNSRELLNFAETILGPVLEHDKATHNELLSTLAAYCANNRNFGDTARNLHMHQNTVRYRIERINELLGEVIMKPEGWFNIELALRILRLQGSIPAL